jgi:hypothetical protein
MSFKIDFVGLIYFYRVSKHEYLLLLPNGTEGTGGIQPHYGSVFLEKRKVNEKTSTWQPLPSNSDMDYWGINEYTLNAPAKLSIGGVNTDARGGCRSLGSRSGVSGSIESRMPHLKDCSDPAIHVVPDKARTIAQISIRQGFLEAFQFGDDHTLVSRLTVTNHQGPIVIANGKDVIEVFDETEIVISNTSDLIGSHGHPAIVPEAAHCNLYSKLADDKQSHTVTMPPGGVPNLPKLPSSQMYILFLRGNHRIPGPDCGNTCC